METITVSVPARPEFLHVIRAVVGTVGAASGASIDVIDDLRLAVQEACAQLLSVATAGAQLRVDVEPGTPARITASLQGATSATWPPESVHDSLAWHILRALVDEVRFARFDGRDVIAFSKNLAAV